jgi:hypothetical protein
MTEESYDSYCDGPDTYFEGKCTCKHEQEDHSWGHCGVDGCECEAGWTE